MGEDLPPQIPSNEQQEEVHIPVNEGDMQAEAAQDIGEAVVGDTAQVQSDDSGEGFQDGGRVDDVEKAHSMALASDEARTVEVKAQKAHEAVTGYMDKQHKISEEDREKRGDKAFPTSEYQDKARELKKDVEAAIDGGTSRYVYIPGEGKKLVDGLYAGDTPERISEALWLAEGNNGERFKSTKDLYERFYSENAEEARDRAERLEEWAGVLHDHPISEEYQKRFPRTEFSPKTLVDWEDYLEREEKHLQGLEGQAAKVRGLDMFFGGVKHSEQWPLASLLPDRYSRDPEWKELAELNANPDTTLGEVAEWYKVLIQRKVIEPRRNMMTVTQQILEDVRTGRASDPNFQAEVDENQHDPKTTY